MTIDATILPNGDLRMVDRRTFPNPSIFVGWPSDRLQDVRVFQDTAYLNDDFVTLDWPAFISSSG